MRQKHSKQLAKFKFCPLNGLMDGASFRHLVAAKEYEVMKASCKFKV